MSALTPASEVILRHSEEFEGRRVLFAGDLQPTNWGDTQWTGTLTTVLEYEDAVGSDVKAIVDARLGPALVTFRPL